MRSALAREARPPELEVASCPTCFGTAHRPFIEAQDDLGGRPGRFSFVRCDSCALVYQNPRIPAASIADWYDDEYLAHRKKQDWGVLSPLVNWAMSRHDRRKLALLRTLLPLSEETRVLDVGCGAGTFLALVAERFGCHVTGVDFKDLSSSPWMRGVEFRCGCLSDQRFGERRFDLITMWHFLEHDYEPRRTLAKARELLADHGRLVIEVPNLDSASFRWFGERWPGLQAPQHTVLFSTSTLRAMALREGYDVVEHLSYGAFPAYFYLFAGAAFKRLKGKGLDFSKVTVPYFAGELLLAPLLAFEKDLDLAMQTIVLRKRS